MSISAASVHLSTFTPPAHRPKSAPPAQSPFEPGNPTATEKPGTSPTQRDFSAALQATLLRAQERASGPRPQ